MRVETDEPGGDWTAPGVWEVADDVWRIPLPLPTDGLRAVNVYAMRDGHGLVLVDSGWAIDEARDALAKALAGLGAGLGDVRRFLVTHLHRDHYTLGVVLRREYGMHVALGLGEQPSLELGRRDDIDTWTTLHAQLHRAGADELADQLEILGRGHVPDHFEEPDEWIAAPVDVALEARTLEALHTPGHTQGHVVFRDAGAGILLAGDHILPHITPSIGFEAAPAESPLGDFLRSLALVRALPDTRLLPAHGPVTPSVHARVDELVAHHATRLDQAQAAVAELGSATTYQTAQRLRWTRRLRAFAELDFFNRSLAVTETAAHLDLLAEQGRLGRTEVDGVRHYGEATASS